VSDSNQLDVEAAVLAYMLHQPEAARPGIPYAQIEQALATQGYSKGAIFQAFQALKSAGKLAR
jgi:hypothetical protein